MFDVSGLVPEARSVAQAVAEIYWRHTTLGRYYPIETSVDDALDVIARGVLFLEAVANWTPGENFSA